MQWNSAYDLCYFLTTCAVKRRQTAIKRRIYPKRCSMGTISALYVLENEATHTALEPPRVSNKCTADSGWPGPRIFVRKESRPNITLMQSSTWLPVLSTTVPLSLSLFLSPSTPFSSLSTNALTCPTMHCELCCAIACTAYVAASPVQTAFESSDASRLLAPERPMQYHRCGGACHFQ